MGWSEDVASRIRNEAGCMGAAWARGGKEERSQAQKVPSFQLGGDEGPAGPACKERWDLHGTRVGRESFGFPGPGNAASGERVAGPQVGRGLTLDLHAAW